MNAFVDESYAELTRRLALGVEPLDPMRGEPLSHAVRVDIERPGTWRPAAPRSPYEFVVLPEDLRARVARHGSGRYTVLYHPVDPPAQYHPPLAANIDVRIYDAARESVTDDMRLNAVPRCLANPALIDKPLGRMQLRGVKKGSLGTVVSGS